ncbi:MAG TPA: SCP2 sterol-binding domain-containing protein [Solirubrobacteraceae bacterium]
MQIFFDNLRYALDTRSLNGGKAVLQWEFTDFEPWHIRIDNGTSTALQGRAESPDVTLKCRFEDWVDVTAGWESPRSAMLKRKIRPSGNLKSLWRAQKLFPN